MAYDEGVAERVRIALEDEAGLEEKKMFGGLAFLLQGNMCCGVLDDRLMARVGPAQYRDALDRPHAREMDFTGKPLTGFLYIDPLGFEEDDDLGAWIGMCVTFARSLPPKR